MKKEWEMYEAVIAAAGMSRRMGAFKPLLPLGNQTILERTVLNFKEAGVCRITVVTGFRGDEIKEKLKDLDVEFVHNPAYDRTDMFASVCLGVKNRRPESKGVLIMPGDAPLIRPATIRHVLECMEAGKGKIIVPVYRGVQGHPPVFSEDMVKQMLRYQGACGLRGFLEQNRESCFYTEVPDAWIYRDTDTPRQYEEAKTAWEKKETPDKELCRAIWDAAETPENVRRHCEKVAETAEELWKLLTKNAPEEGARMDLEKITAGALLHDVKRQEPRHAEAGARFLEELGFSDMARLAAAHTELLGDTVTDLGEEVLVYLADRMVLHDERCRIRKRYEAKAEQMKGNEEGLRRLSKDMKRCKFWCQRIKEMTGYDLYE